MRVAPSVSFFLLAALLAQAVRSCAHLEHERAQAEEDLKDARKTAQVNADKKRVKVDGVDMDGLMNDIANTKARVFASLCLPLLDVVFCRCCVLRCALAQSARCALVTAVLACACRSAAASSLHPASSSLDLTRSGRSHALTQVSEAKAAHAEALRRTRQADIDRKRQEAERDLETKIQVRVCCPCSQSVGGLFSAESRLLLLFKSS